MDWVGREPPVGVFRPDLIAARSFALADAARRLLRGTAAIALGLAWSAGAGAADLQWSADGITPGGGGSANWNTAVPARWYNGVSFQTWNNAALDTAVFGGVAGTVTINAPVTAQNLTFNTSGYTVTRTGANTLTLAGANPTINVAAGTATVSTVIAGTAGLTKAGAGALTLSGANTYTGGTTINAGTVAFSADTNLGNAAGGITFNGGTLQNTATVTTNRGVTVNAGGGALNTNAATTLTLGGVITGSGPLAKNGTGTLTLTGESPSFTGTTTVNAGTLQIGAGATGSVAGDIVNNSALVFNRTGTPTYGGAISGAGTVTKSGTGTLTLTGANTYSGATTISSSGGTLRAGATNAFSANSAHTLNTSAVLDLGGFSQTIGSLAGSAGTVTNSGVAAATLTTGGNNTSTVFSGIIQNGVGGTSLTKEGTGTFTLAGNNTYTGATTINAGTLQIGNGGSSGNVSGDIVNNSALVFNRTGSLTYGGVISGSGSVTKNGSVTLTLTGNNAYSGGTTINAGTLVVNSDARLGAASGGLTFGGGTLQSTATFASARDVTLSGNGTFNTNSGTTLTLGGVISGGGALTKSGSGTLTLTGTNSYNGGTTISGGTLAVSSDANLGNAAGGLTFASGGTLRFDTGFTSNRGVTLNAGGGVFNTNGNSATLNGAIAGVGTLTKSGTGTLTLTANNTNTGNTTISGGTLQLGNGGAAGIVGGNISLGSTSSTLVFNRSDDLTYGGNITGSGAASGGFTKNGGNTLTLSGANTYTGGTAINGGTLKAGANNRFSASSTHTVASGAFLDLAGFNQAIGALAGAGTVTNSAAAGATLTAGGNNGSTTFSGVIEDGAGTTSLTKAGTGTLTLSGTNTYSGGTTINAGTLAVSSDANLGAASGALTFNGGTLQTTGNLSSNRDITLNGNGTFNANSGTISTLGGVISGVGSFTKIGTGTLTLSGTNSYAGGTTISGGTLAVSSDANLGNASGALTLSGGGTLRFDAGVTSNRGVTLNAGGGVFNTNGNSATLNGAIAGVGPLTKSGAGTLTLAGPNTYSGATTISANGGTLQAGAQNAFSPNSAVSLSTNTTLDLNGFDQTIGSLASTGGGGGRLLTNSGASAAILTTGGAANTTFSGVIADGVGGVSLVKQGTGTFTLTGTNTYTGGTTISSGTLQVGTGTAGSILGDVVNNAALIFNRSNGSSYGGVISGTGTVTKSGTGTLTLTGDSTYTGGTTITAGTLQLGNGGTSGSIVGNVLNNSALVFNRSDALSFGGVISGTGAVTQAGTGTTTLTAANTYGGGTTLNAGTLAVSNNANLGNASGGLSFGGGTLQYLSGFTSNRAVTLNAGGGTFDTNGNDATLAGAINGAGGLVKSGAGTLTLSGSSAYAGATNVNGGTLQAGALNAFSATSAHAVNAGAVLDLAGFNQTIGSLAGAGTVTNTGVAGAALTTGGNNASTTFSGVLQDGAGATGLVKLGAGTLTLSGANTYSGGTTLAAGTLRLENDAALGSGSLTTTGSVVDYAAGVSIGNPLVVNSNATQLQVTTGTATQAGLISELGGPRPIEKTGAGVLVLTAANTYTGGTTISAGTLQLGNGGAGGSIAGAVINNGVLAINRSDTYAFNGVISGTGALVQNGTGATILTTTNTYSGTTTINAGTLVVDGSIANSPVFVNNGALLTGNGAVGPTTINGALLPGQSIGTITVNGDLTFGAVGVYFVEVSPASADRTNVIGTATLNGTVLAIFAPGSYITRQYTILHADGGLGGTRFTSLNSSNMPASLTANLSYTSSDVILNLTADLAAAIGAAGLSRNQQNVASGLDAYFNNGGTMPPSFSGLFGLTGTTLGAALTLLSGEAATGAQQVGLAMTGQFLGLMLDPFVDGRSGATGADGPALGFAPETGTQPERLTVAYPSALQAAGNKAATFEQRIGPWGAAYGGTSRTAGDPIGIGSHDLSARSAGIVGGLDLRLTPDAVVGIALAGGGAQWSVAQGLGGGQSDAFQAGIYGATRYRRRLSVRRACLHQSLDGDRPLRSWRRPPHRQIQCAGLRCARRGRLSARNRVRGVHALCRPAGAEAGHAELRRDRSYEWRIRARLSRAHRDRNEKRTGRPFRPRAGAQRRCGARPARAARLGARLGERSHAGRGVPRPSRRGLHGDRRPSREGFTARLGRLGASPCQRPVADREVQRRVRRSPPGLWRHWDGALRLVRRVNVARERDAQFRTAPSSGKKNKVLPAAHALDRRACARQILPRDQLQTHPPPARRQRAPSALRRLIHEAFRMPELSNDCVFRQHRVRELRSPARLYPRAVRDVGVDARGRPLEVARSPRSTLCVLRQPPVRRLQLAHPRRQRRPGMHRLPP